MATWQQDAAESLPAAKIYNMRFLPDRNTNLLLLLLFCVATRGLAQPGELQFKHLTPNDGLTQGVIHSVFTDSRGFVWMTGLDGINRFDGIKCLANSEIAPGMEGVSITTGIVEDNNGDIWFGYAEGLIKYSYSDNFFTLVPARKLLANRLVNSGDFISPVAVGADGSILLYHDYSLLFFFNPANATVTELPPLMKDGYTLFGLGLTNVKAGFSNNLYAAATIDNVIYLYCYEASASQKPRWKFLTRQVGITGNRITMVQQDDNNLIIASETQIARYRIDGGTFDIKPLPKMDLPELAVDKNKNIWIGTLSKGIYYVDGHTLNVNAHYQHEVSNPGGIMGDIAKPYCDKLGNVWVASKYKGVDYCNLSDIKFLSSFTEQQRNKEVSSSFIRDLVQDAAGNFYAASGGAGILVLDQQLQFVKKLSGIPANLVCPDMLLQDKWLYITSDIFSSPYLFKYNLQTNSVKSIPVVPAPNKISSTSLYQLSAMADEHLLAASYNGLFKFNTTTDIFEYIPGITNHLECVVFSHEDHHGQIYKGISNGGLTIYRPSSLGYNAVFELEKKLTVKHCAEINDSLMWIGTNNGLYLFNTKVLTIRKHFTMANGMPNNVVYAIMPTKNGNLWLSTNMGLSYLNIITGHFENFTVADGLQSNEFNTHTVVKAADDRVVFGGVNGLTTVNPAMLQKKTLAPIVQLTAIRADSSINPYFYTENNTLHLPAGSNAIDFEITAIDYVHLAKCKVQYRLLGYDNEWREANNPATARYIKLRHGKYVFEYRATNVKGEWAGGSKSFPFEIAAFWWQTKWFQAVIMFLAIGITIVSIRLYVQVKLRHQRLLLEKKLAVQVEIERITADLHDDVGATLSSMHIYSELAGNMVEAKPLQSKEMMGKISQQGKDLLGRMSDIIWSLKPASEQQYSISSRLRNFSQELLAAREKSTVLEINETLDTQITNPLVRKNILLIAREAMHNIAKYSQAGKVVIRLQELEGKIVLQICDNGCGFDILKAPQGNGLHNMRRRCNQLKGDFELISATGNGTTIQCTFDIAIIRHTS